MLCCFASHTLFHMPCCHGRVVTKRILNERSKNRYLSRFSLAEGKRCAAPLYGCFNPDLKLAQCVLLEDLITFVIRATAILTNLITPNLLMRWPHLLCRAIAFRECFRRIKSCAREAAEAA
mmetsp:Transcript_31167/g.50219  ORF Transcript_31167/g.50219 Transcript_31167/m.50219 type:complete len:121 (-) Transcript_31167:207-569(-)